MIVALSMLAVAYEVDGWTPRTQSLDDSTGVANIAFDQMLDRAIDRVGRCSTDDAVLRRRLARSIARVTSRRVILTDRKSLAAFGYGAYSGWLERDPRIDRVTTGHEGMFAGVGVGQSLVLRFAGTASTVRFGEVYLGTDKVDHFLSTGFHYYRWSNEAEDPARAVRRGVRMERRFFGQWTSKAYSPADLEANWDGYRFYAGLLTKGSPVQRDEDGCLQRVATWDWSTWIDPGWDEFRNPSRYSPRVAQRVEEQLAPDRASICAAWRPWGPQVEDPFNLDGFCSDDPR